MVRGAQNKAVQPESISSSAGWPGRCTPREVDDRAAPRLDCAMRTSALYGDSSTADTALRPSAQPAGDAQLALQKRHTLYTVPRPSASTFRVSCSCSVALESLIGTFVARAHCVRVLHHPASNSLRSNREKRRRGTPLASVYGGGCRCEYIRRTRTKLSSYLTTVRPLHARLLPPEVQLHLRRVQ